MAVEVKVLPNALDYSFNYLQELNACFYLPPKHTPHEFVSKTEGPDGLRPGKTGAHWLVLFNAHTQQELNLTNTYDPKKRTIKWGTPFDNAVVSMTKGGSPHDNSALLRDWFLEKVRKFATFICVPPKSDLRFWSGYACPMTAKWKDPKGSPTDFTKETRPGGGMQFRLLGLPKGTICLTTGLFTEESGKTAQKEDKKIDVQARLAECVAEYNKAPQGSVKLPQDLAKPRTIGNGWDDEAILKFYMDPSMSQLRAYDPARDHA